MASDIWIISNMKEICIIRATTPLHFLFETFVSKPPFICNHHQTLNNKIGETFREGLKWMCKLFEKNEKKGL